jgi:hypothetical protein
MPDWLLVSAGLVTCSVAWTLGYVTRTLVEGRRNSYRCGCAHSLAFHDPTTNECHHTVTRPQCAASVCECRQYVGRRPTMATLGLWDPSVPEEEQS